MKWEGMELKTDSLRKKDSNRLHGLLLLFIVVYTVWWMAKKGIIN